MKTGWRTPFQSERRTYNLEGKTRLGKFSYKNCFVLEMMAKSGYVSRRPEKIWKRTTQVHLSCWAPPPPHSSPSFPHHTRTPSPRHIRHIYSHKATSVKELAFKSIVVLWRCHLTSFVCASPGAWPNWHTFSWLIGDLGDIRPTWVVIFRCLIPNSRRYVSMRSVTRSLWYGTLPPGFS